MVRTIVAGVVGGLVYYVWGMLVWMVIPLHLPTIGTLPDEAAVTQVLKAQGLETGVYVAPWSDDEAEWEDPESEWTKNHLAGPLYTVFYRREGRVPMSPAVMLGGLAIAVAGSLLASFLLRVALPLPGGFLGRAGFVAALGLFVAIVAHLSYWNWMNFATDYTMGFLADNVLGWSITGAVIAAIVKPASGSPPPS